MTTTNPKRTRRTTLLLDREPLHVEYAMAHPKQRAHVAILAERIDALRKAKSDQSLVELQEDLIERMMTAQADQDAAKRQQVKLARQRNADPAEVQRADAELVVADRIVRQLRAIGDGIAWHTARFHRQTFVVTAHEPGGGPIYGKQGWVSEVARARDIWQSTGEVAIINGLTNCLRAADVTVFGKSGVRLEEVKSRAGSRRAGQKARWRELESAINTGTPYATPGGVMQVWECPVQLRTRIKTDLQAAIQDADRVGTSTRQLGEGWILMVTTREGYRLNRSSLTVSEVKKRRADAIARAGMLKSPHYLRFASVDMVSRGAWSAPFSVFPLSPQDCAGLICDYTVYESLMSFDRFSEAVTKLGLQVEHHLPRTATPNDGSGNFATLKSTRVHGSISRTRSLHLKASVVTQLLLELVEPSVYAKGYVEAMGHSMSPGASGIIVFANERAAWR
jgi:hypothetical protein